MRHPFINIRWELPRSTSPIIGSEALVAGFDGSTFGVLMKGVVNTQSIHCLSYSMTSIAECWSIIVIWRQFLQNTLLLIKPNWIIGRDLLSIQVWSRGDLVCMDPMDVGGQGPGCQYWIYNVHTGRLVETKAPRSFHIEFKQVSAWILVSNLDMIIRIFYAELWSNNFWLIPGVRAHRQRADSS